MTGAAEPQIAAVEKVLTSHLGPIGPITLNTQLKNLGLVRDELGPDDIPLLVDQIGEAVSDLIGDVKGREIAQKMQESLSQVG